MRQLGNENAEDWKIVYHETVVKIDIPRLSKHETIRVKNAIETKIAVNPSLYGLPLRATLKRYWKLRVGDYRIVYLLSGNEIRILAIAHRQNVYKIANKRIF